MDNLLATRVRQRDVNTQLGSYQKLMNLDMPWSSKRLKRTKPKRNKANNTSEDSRLQIKSHKIQKNKLTKNKNLKLKGTFSKKTQINIRQTRCWWQPVKPSRHR